VLCVCCVCHPVCVCCVSSSVCVVCHPVCVVCHPVCVIQCVLCVCVLSSVCCVLCVIQCVLCVIQCVLCVCVVCHPYVLCVSSSVCVVCHPVCVMCAIQCVLCVIQCVLCVTHASILLGVLPAQVKLPLLNSEFLMERVRKEDIILNDRAAIDILMEAIHFQMMPDKQSTLHSHRSQPRKHVPKLQVGTHMYTHKHTTYKHKHYIHTQLHYTISSTIV